MSMFFKFLFEIATNPLDLPISPLYEYAILAVIGLVVYIIAYRKVGDMYRCGLINGRTEGSFFHWFIRGFFFMVLWLTVYEAIKVYYFVCANWKIILMIIGSVAGTAMLCVLAVSAIRLLKKHMALNGNT